MGEGRGGRGGGGSRGGGGRGRGGVRDANTRRVDAARRPGDGHIATAADRGAKRDPAVGGPPGLAGSSPGYRRTAVPTAVPEGSFPVDPFAAPESLALEESELGRRLQPEPGQLQQPLPERLGYNTATAVPGAAGAETFARQGAATSPSPQLPSAGEPPSPTLAQLLAPQPRVAGPLPLLATQQQQQRRQRRTSQRPIRSRRLVPYADGGEAPERQEQDSAEAATERGQVGEFEEDLMALLWSAEKRRVLDTIFREGAAAAAIAATGASAGARGPLLRRSVVREEPWAPPARMADGSGDGAESPAAPWRTAGGSDGTAAIRPSRSRPVDSGEMAAAQALKALRHGGGFFGDKTQLLGPLVRRRLLKNPVTLARLEGMSESYTNAAAREAAAMLPYRYGVGARGQIIDLVRQARALKARQVPERLRRRVLSTNVGAGVADRGRKGPTRGEYGMLGNGGGGDNDDDYVAAGLEEEVRLDDDFDEGFGQIGDEEDVRPSSDADLDDVDLDLDLGLDDLDDPDLQETEALMTREIARLVGVPPSSLAGRAAALGGLRRPGDAAATHGSARGRRRREEEEEAAAAAFIRAMEGHADDSSDSDDDDREEDEDDDLFYGLPDEGEADAENSDTDDHGLVDLGLREEDEDEEVMDLIGEDELSVDSSMIGRARGFGARHAARTSGSVAHEWVRDEEREEHEEQEQEEEDEIDAAGSGAARIRPKGTPASSPAAAAAPEQRLVDVIQYDDSFEEDEYGGKIILPRDAAQDDEEDDIYTDDDDGDIIDEDDIDSNVEALLDELLSFGEAGDGDEAAAGEGAVDSTVTGTRGSAREGRTPGTEPRAAAAAAAVTSLGSATGGAVGRPAMIMAEPAAADAAAAQRAAAAVFQVRSPTGGTKATATATGRSTRMRSRAPKAAAAEEASVESPVPDASSLSAKGPETRLLVGSGGKRSSGLAPTAPAAVSAATDAASSPRLSARSKQPQSQQPKQRRRGGYLAPAPDGWQLYGGGGSGGGDPAAAAREGGGRQAQTEWESAEAAPEVEEMFKMASGAAADGGGGIGGMSGGVTATNVGTPPRLVVRAFLYCIGRDEVYDALWRLDLLDRLEFVPRLRGADLVLHRTPAPGERQFSLEGLRRAARRTRIPFISVRQATEQELGPVLARVFRRFDEMYDKVLSESTHARPAAADRRGAAP